MPITLKKGFTLVELLAVIAIVAILVLIAAPSFMGGKEKAKLALMKSDIKTVEQAVGLHLLEYETLGKSKKHSGFTKENPDYSNKEKIYDVKGEFKGDILEGGELYDVSKLISSSLNKTGIFIANDKGKAFYVLGANPKNELPFEEDEEEIKLP